MRISKLINKAENCEDDSEKEEEYNIKNCERKIHTDALEYAERMNTFLVKTTDNEGLKFITTINEHLEIKVCVKKLKFPIQSL